MLIGVDVGGTNLRVGVVENYQVIWEQRYHADFSGLCQQLQPAEALKAIHASLAQSLSEAITLYPKVSAIGIGFPGFINPATQQVAQSPNLPGLLNADITAPISQLLKLPVLLENDALAAAYGEYVLANKPNSSLIYLGLGTGVGGGLVLNGKPYGGSNGVAMEVGHLTVMPSGRPCGCGNCGCMEQYASASGVVLNYQEISGKVLDTVAIAALANQGDKSALQAYAQAGTALAQGLAHILKVVDVTQVVIGGGLSQSWALLQPAFEARLETDLIPALRGKVQVSISSAGDQAGIIGAAMLAA
ncbi:MAG: ROK family protein [Methylophilaceae bacterium]